MIIVLDDDPTGSQTVHGCLLLTRWDVDTLRIALCDDAPLSLPSERLAQRAASITHLTPSSAVHQCLHPRRHALGGDAVEGHDLGRRRSGLATLPAHDVAARRTAAQ